MYSPKIKERYIPALYRLAKSRGRPMTAVVNEMISDALEKSPSAKDSEIPKWKGGSR